MIHIVSGMPRSGTSAMMAAMQAGGLDVVYSEERDKLAAAHSDSDYQPNPDCKLYETPLHEYGELNFPLQYQGKCLKVLLWGLDSLAVNPDGYRIVIMRRDPEEIRQSYEAFFGHPLRHPWMNEYEQRLRRAYKMIENRNDVASVHLVDYQRLTESPLHEISRLCWLIHAGKAAATIDPTQYRFRKELLTAGI